MGILDLFRRKSVETRASGTGYTAAIMGARAAYITGQSGLAEATATAQSCVSLWENAFAGADVIGADLLDRRTMALAGAFSGAPRRKRFPDPRSARAGLRLGSEHPRRRASGLSAFRLRGRRRAFRNRARGRGAAPADRGGPDSAMDRDRAIAAGIALGAAPARIGDRFAWRIPRRAARIDDRSAGRRRRRRARGSPRPSSRQAWRGARDRASVTSHRRRRSDAGPGAGSPHPAIARGGGCRDAGPGAGGHLRRVRRSAGPYQSRDHGADGPRGATPSGDMDPATDRRDGGRGSRREAGGTVEIDVHRPLQSFDAGGSARAVSGIIEALARAKEAGLSPAEISAAFGALDWREALKD